jgi:acetoacetate decarboxylase
MNIADIRSKAFAMPFTSPAFPPGPYRFVNREYLIVTYRTDPDLLREVLRSTMALYVSSPPLWDISIRR